jgi:hypothetical protein
MNIYITSGEKHKERNIVKKEKRKVEINNS